MRLIRYSLICLSALLLLANTVPSVDIKTNIPDNQYLTNLTVIPAYSITKTTAAGQYAAWNLHSSGLSEEAFELGVKGYRFLEQKAMLSRTDLLTIIDYSQPSSQKRLYVINMTTGKLIFHTLVAHGKNSGYNYATSFSNEEESLKTSLGFYITQGTYNGTNGYSLKLKGCEQGINDNAINRAIVFHGADYVSEDFIHSKGYLGRSYGCPAVPMAWHKKIIDKIRNGTCMFLYHPSKSYITRSKILDS